MERRWFNSKKELECRCGLNKSMDNLGPIENTGEIEDSNRKDTTKNIQSWGGRDDSNYNTVDFLSILKTISADPDFYSNVENVEFFSILKTIKIGDPDFHNVFLSSLLDIWPFWKDRNGDVYRIQFDRENKNLELEATCLDELPNFYRYLCFRGESTNEDTSSNNNLNNINNYINSYIDYFIQSEINIVIPMEINIENLSTSYISRSIFGESLNNDIEDISDIDDSLNDIEDIRDIEDSLNDIEDISDIDDSLNDIEDISDIEDSLNDIEDISDIDDSFTDREAFWEGEDSFTDREAFWEGEDSFTDREAFGEGEDSFTDREAFGEGEDSFNDREAFGEGEDSSSDIHNIAKKILNNNSEKNIQNTNTNWRSKNGQNGNFQESTLNIRENSFSNNRENNSPNSKMGVQNDFHFHFQEDAFNERENSFSNNIQNISKDIKDISVHDTFDFNDFNEGDAVATNTENCLDNTANSLDNNIQYNCNDIEGPDNDIGTENSFKGWTKEAIYAHVEARVKAICEDMDNLSKTFHNVGDSSCTNDGERHKDMVKATEAQDEHRYNDSEEQGTFKDEKIESEESCKGRERGDTSNDREVLCNDGEDSYNDGGYNYNVGEGTSNDGEENCNDNDETDKFSKFKHLWVLCDNCYTLNYKRLLRSRMSICEHCEWYLKMNSSDRLDLSIDPDTWDPMDEDMVSLDPIEFEGDSEEESYKDRLDSYQTTTGLPEAVQTGIGELNGIPVAVGVMDFEFIGGSMASVVGEKITRLIEYATNQFLPLIIVCASGGARMQEGSVSLMQMAKISSVLYDYQLNKKLFYISILASPTTGGVTASFGMLGDIIIAEPNAYIAFAGKRVIEETLKITVPEGVQETEYLFDKGSFDLIVPRKFLKSVLTELLNLHAFFPLIQNENKKQIEG